MKQVSFREGIKKVVVFDKRARDLTGLGFGKLLVVEFSGYKNKKGSYLWNCLCDCGEKTTLSSNNLLNNYTKSCGCFSKGKLREIGLRNLVGKRFGKRLVIGQQEGKDGISYCETLCDCGKIRVILSNSLVVNNPKSCGCEKKTLIQKDRDRKVCGRCREEKNINLFSKNKNRKDGHSQYCFGCKLEIDAQHRKTEKHVEYTTNYQREKRKDVGYRIRQNLSRRINYAIKRKPRKTLEFLGCDVDYLKKHLQKSFTNKMNWENYGSYWEIDHIKPCALFDLTKIEEQNECFHFTNLQALSKIDNIKKGKKYGE